MLPEKYLWITAQFEPEGNPRHLCEIARELADEGNLAGAATVYDRAYGIDPADREIRLARARLLARLEVIEHGIRFCYVPAGPFLMGSQDGEADERPLHPVWLSPYWMSETPVSWAAFCRLLDWEPPPAGFPRNREVPQGGHDRAGFHLQEANKIRLQYCEDHTLHARDWHSHVPPQPGDQRQGIFRAPPRSDDQLPWQYETKPMIAIAWQEAEELARAVATAEVRYCLPSEAQWEKAARGGLIGARYPWGDQEPSEERCDFDRFHEFSILPMKTFAPNGYGLFAMSGCVWEWTRDRYDHDYYHHMADADPEGPAQGQAKVLRGGSWSDCAEAVTVTFRMSAESTSWRDGEWGRHLSPNIGFRLCRIRLSTNDGPA